MIRRSTWQYGDRSGLPRRTAAAVLAVCALLVSACGREPVRSFTPRGGIMIDSSAQPSAATPSEDAGGTETINLVPGLRAEIEWPQGLDPQRRAAVRAFGADFAAQWRAVGSLGADQSYLKGVEEAATQDALAWVHGFVDAGQSARGVARLYALRVSALEGRGAEVDGCVDLSGVRLTDRDGKRLARQPDWVKPPKSVFLQAAGMRRGADGVWRVRLYRHAAYPDERAKECVR